MQRTWRVAGSFCFFLCSLIDPCGPCKRDSSPSLYHRFDCSYHGLTVQQSFALGLPREAVDRASLPKASPSMLYPRENGLSSLARGLD